MSTSKLSRIRKLEWLALGLAVLFMFGKLCHAAPPYPGANLRDHGHTSQGDGGILSNLVSQRIGVSRTMAWRASPIFDSIMDFSWTNLGVGLNGVGVGLYVHFTATGTSNSGVGHSIGILGFPSNSATTGVTTIGVEGRVNGVSQRSGATLVGVLGLGSWESDVTTGTTNTIIGVEARGEVYQADATTARTTGTVTCLQIDAAIGGATKNAVNQLGTADNMLWRGTSFFFGSLDISNAAASSNAIITGVSNGISTTSGTFTTYLNFPSGTVTQSTSSTRGDLGANYNATGSAVTLTTTGGPVLLTYGVCGGAVVATAYSLTAHILRNGSQISGSDILLQSTNGSSSATNCLNNVYIDRQAAGTYSWAIEYQNVQNGGHVAAMKTWIDAIELKK